MLRPAVPDTPADTELVALLQRAAAEWGPGVAAASAASAGAALPGAPATGESHPSDPRFVQAGNALGSGNASEAIRLLQKIPVGDAASEARRVPMLAMAYVRENRPDEAVKTGAEYVRKNPQNSADRKSTPLNSNH